MQDFSVLSHRQMLSMLGHDWGMMDPEEAELQNDYRYRSYAAVIEKALRNFESSSEWADLISSLGKLNKVLKAWRKPINTLRDSGYHLL